MPDLLSVVKRYKENGILIDTNLAVLYLVGSVDPRGIARNRRTTSYTADDFERISKFVDAFDNKFFTPNILTEISNLLGRNGELSRALAAFVAIGGEVYIPASTVVEGEDFFHFGLTDASILASSNEKFLVLTDDNDLTLRLKSLGRDVVGIDTLRAI